MMFLNVNNQIDSNSIPSDATTSSMKLMLKARLMCHNYTLTLPLLFKNVLLFFMHPLQWCEHPQKEGIHINSSLTIRQFLIQEHKVEFQVEGVRPVSATAWKQKGWRSNTSTSPQRDFTFGKIHSTRSVKPCRFPSYLGCLIPSHLFSPPVIHPDRTAGYNERMRLTEEVLISVDDMCESSISFSYYSPCLSSSVRVSRAVCLTHALVCGNLVGPVGRGTR